MRHNICKLNEVIKRHSDITHWIVEDQLTVFKTDLKVDSDFSTVAKEGISKADFFSIILLTEGEVDFMIDFREYKLKGPSLVFVPPNSARELKNIRENSFIEGVMFTSAFFKNLSMTDNLGTIMEFFSKKFHPFWLISQEESEDFTFHINRMCKKIDQLHQRKFGMQLLYLTFLEFLIEVHETGSKYVDENQFQFGRKEELVSKFSHLAKEHHLTERKLEFYAEKLFITSKYLSETVKEITGAPAGKLLDYLNVLEAKRLLRNTDLNISEISNRLNFSSPAFFTKFFNRLEGMSPKNYRATKFGNN